MEQIQPNEIKYETDMSGFYVDEVFNQYAECRGEDLSKFFDFDDNYREAKQICNKCPIKNFCLDFAIEEGLIHGMYGGKSERERRRLSSLRRSQTQQIGEIAVNS